MRIKIGSFMRDTQGIMHGKIYGLGFVPVSVLFEPQLDEKDAIICFALIADPVLEAYEIGRAWEKQKGEMVYYSVCLDSPLFAAPLNVALFPEMGNPNRFNLVLDRAREERRFLRHHTNELAAVVGPA
jgi:uncharacterized protein (DUF736 family)